jgi:hypothetical protein
MVRLESRHQNTYTDKRPQVLYKRKPVKFDSPPKFIDDNTEVREHHPPTSTYRAKCVN